MIQKYNKLSLATGIPGLLLRLLVIPLPFIFPLDGIPLAIAGWTCWVAGTVLLFVGFVFYTKSRGRCWAWALFAILGFLGLIVMACLKDKTVPPPINDPLLKCPSCGAPYRISEYESDAPEIRCSKCKTVLPRN